MIINYFKTALRNIYRNLTFSIINILGLAVGLTGFIIILMYLHYEKSYDTWHPALKTVYRVGIENGDGIAFDGRTQSPLASFLKEQVKEVQAATRISGGMDFEILLEANNKKIYQNGMVEVDSLFFSVFPYQFIRGNASNALNSPDAVVISQPVAERFFGDEDPMGKTMKIFAGAVPVTITGVVKPVNTPTELKAEIFYRSPWEKGNHHWQNFSYTTFIRVTNPIDDKQFSNNLTDLFAKNQLNLSGDEYTKYISSTSTDRFFTEQLDKIHTEPRSGGGKTGTITVLLLLAATLLIGGAINFSNLSLASSFNKSKEVGVRKVLGAGSTNIFKMHFFNTAIQCIISLLIAALLVSMITPWFKSEFNVELDMINGIGFKFYIQIIVLILVVMLLSGVYPSLVFSRFNPVQVLKGNRVFGNNKYGFRNGLIIVQFVFSAFFIICSLVIYKQVTFIQNRDKGFSGEQVLRIESTHKSREQNFDIIRRKLMTLPGVLAVSKSTTVPGDTYIDTSLTKMKWNHKEVGMNEVKVSTDYFNTINTQLIDGRMFDDRYSDQHTRSVIINEAAAALMNTSNPIGQILIPVGCDTVPREIIGVVKNFQVQGANVPVKPAMFLIGNFACSFRSGGAILVKLEAGNPQNTLMGIENLWKEAEPGVPIRYIFLNDNFQKLFSEYRRLQRIVGWFTITSLLIAMMGLFAMSAFLVKQKSRELSIRKVLGADVWDIFKMVAGRYLINISIATLIAIPLSWFAAQKWLQGFAFRFQLSWTLFAIASITLVAIASITISLQVSKAVFVNPVSSLKSE